MNESAEFVRGAKDGKRRRVFGRGEFLNLGGGKGPTHQTYDMELDGRLVTQVIRLSRVERARQ